MKLLLIFLLHNFCLLCRPSILPCLKIEMLCQPLHAGLTEAYSGTAKLWFWHSSGSHVCQACDRIDSSSGLIGCGRCRWSHVLNVVMKTDTAFPSWFYFSDWGLLVAHINFLDDSLWFVTPCWRCVLYSCVSGFMDKDDKAVLLICSGQKTWIAALVLVSTSWKPVLRN